MRIWINPDKLSNLGLNVNQVANAIKNKIFTALEL